MVENPKHLALILDGNRRFAKKYALAPLKGHEKGKEKVRSMLTWAKELGFTEVTVYAFSIQNFTRSKEEVAVLMSLFMDACEELLVDKEKNDLCVRFIGRRELLATKIQEKMLQVERETKNNKPYTFNICLAYGGREEITDAVRALAKKVEEGSLNSAEINEEVIQAHLQLQHEPDMIIRTSGEQRTSNFLPWQSTYSEWFFINTFWPEFEKEDLEHCLEEFKKRDRRYGGK
jgi:tritrans,polycis-undecaprenyl-diphosphate synthase [geranylgeranyl-diphosphate specific]